MAKSLATYWNPLVPENQGRWTPIRGLEGMAEELTLSIDPATGEYTRLTRFLPGADTTPFGGKSHTYPEEKGLEQGRFIVKNGLQSDVTFEEQEDGRFRSEQMLPDEEVTVTAHATGYKDATTKVKLAEGTTKDVEIVLKEKE